MQPLKHKETTKNIAGSHNATNKAEESNEKFNIKKALGVSEQRTFQFSLYKFVENQMTPEWGHF